jgi:hypothetical protein
MPRPYPPEFRQRAPDLVRSGQAAEVARAFYDQQRANGHGHNDALRRLANRLVGILHGCLKTRTLYNEDTAWAHRQQQAA